jgi:hypothetical protein
MVISVSTGMPDVILSSDRDWPRWLATLQELAAQHNAWHLVDPDAPDVPVDMLRAPLLPSSAAQLIQQLDEQRQRRYREWQAERAVLQQSPDARASEIASTAAAAPTLRRDPGEPPNREPAEYADVEHAFEASLSIYKKAWEEYVESKARLAEIKAYLNRTIASHILLPCVLERAMTQSTDAAPFTIQQLVQDLRDRLEPTRSASAIDAARADDRILNQARSG